MSRAIRGLTLKPLRSAVDKSRMSSLDHRWTMAAVAGAGRSWFAALLMRQRRRWVGKPSEFGGSDDSRMGLDERILATRTQIAAMHRSLAMQKHALNATRRAGQRITTGPWSRPATATAAPAKPHLDLLLDDDHAHHYADTEPMSAFLDSQPFAHETAQK